ncbi:MAG: helix-turn-helix domain-containing protein [Sphingobacteriales bacterium]
MTDSAQTQQLFFNHIRSKLASHLSFVDEVAELLNISNDSAYRRIRGEKPMGLDEIQVLCNKYHVSLDQLLQIKTNTVIFTDDRVDHLSSGFNKWLQFVSHSLAIFNVMQNPFMYWYSKDLPVFSFIPFPELTAFKFFFWKRTLLGYPDLARQKFNGVEADIESIEITKKIDELYAKIPSIDIWNGESINATINQIEFYRQSNVFSGDDVLFKVYSQLEDLVNHLELQAETGKKLSYSKPDMFTNVTYEAYINETLIGDNTICVRSDNIQVTFINHNGLNFMSTQDKGFCDFTYQHLQNVIRKSTHISVVGEKERVMFFHKLRAKIQERKNSIN